MTKNADGIYTLTLPANADTTNAKVIFNNGSAKCPDRTIPALIMCRMVCITTPV